MSLITRLCLLLLVLFAEGCSTGNAMQAWQAEVERYIIKEGNRDPNVLRDVRGRPSQREFGVIGAAEKGFPFFAPARTDVTGVLLGHRLIESQHWYIFLVGAVQYHGAFVDFPLEDAQVKDLRLAAFSGDNGEFRWQVSDEDAAAVEQYRQPQVESWRRSHPSRADSTDVPTSFPTPADNFRLTVEPPLVTVLDEHSLARWTLLVPPRREP